MLSDSLKSMYRRLEQFETGEPIPVGMVAVIRREVEAMHDMARSMENTPIPVNQQLTTRHLKDGVALFPIAPRRTGGGR